VRQRGFPSIGNLKCKDGKYLSNAAFAQAHFWAPFCDTVGLPEMRDTVPAGDAEMIRKVKAHMLTKTRDEWLAIIPKEISVVPMLEFDEVLEGSYAKERGMVLELDHPMEERYANWHRRSVCPTRRRAFAALRRSWANTRSKRSRASVIAKTKSARSKRPA